MNQKKIEKAFFEVIEALGDQREELKETPARIAKSYEEIFSGVNIDPRKILTKTFSVDSDDLIIEKNIDFYSMCEHHFLPFFGQISLAYIPNKKIFGFGDIIKLIEITPLLVMLSFHHSLLMYIWISSQDKELKPGIFLFQMIQL